MDEPEGACPELTAGSFRNKHHHLHEMNEKSAAMNNEIENTDRNETDPAEIILPMAPLRDVVVFPNQAATLLVGRTKSINALMHAAGGKKAIFVSMQKKAEIDIPLDAEVNEVGTVCMIREFIHLPNGTVNVLLEGKARARALRFVSNDDFSLAHIEPLSEAEVSTIEEQALCRSLKERFQAFAPMGDKADKDFAAAIGSIGDASRLADRIAAHVKFKSEDAQRILETVDVAKRSRLILDLIRTEIAIRQMEKQIDDRAKDRMEEQRKNYYLQEKIRALKKEMGGAEDADDDLLELEKQIEEKKMTEGAAEKVAAEFKKLKRMPPMSPESTVIRNYIDWMLNLPWCETTQDLNGMDAAEKILNAEHYGLEKPKERILEYLAVQTLVKKVQGPILCFVGPPGVGKTSLAQSIANAAGRKYVRVCLGGVRDEAEIRGHRRTYIGAMPGKIIQSLKKAGVNNPVLCLDEVDKMSMDFRGDPSAALLEVLDPEQNDKFNDHYLDIDYDLSDTLFIMTANSLEGVPLPLLDRMEIIRLSGYTENEKLRIAQKYLIPRQIEMNGLSNLTVTFSKNALMLIIDKYTREAGVRNLKRQISSICSKIAREHVNDRAKTRFNITVKSVRKYLGAPVFRHGRIEDKDQVGYVTGLAWTRVGGELLGVETATVPGNGKLTVTGKLGEVMKESAEAAVTYVRSRSRNLLIDEEFHKKLDMHIHMPEGAIPKDGPSAGITMCTAIASALTKRPVRRDVAMTGEITLRGNVLPIGGLKEKILAAHRGGIKKVLIPKPNAKDLADIPANILKQLEIVPVEHMDEVLSHALVSGKYDALFVEDDLFYELT